ncbi:transglutaminase family protein [Actinokineospora sp.]|uniref:transglutaminase family protein n=1 Tax=Actinokineospora sp. TaxID=1872133 RepID=UPI004037F16D
MSRIAVACVLAATAVAGLLFEPVFGLWALVLPIAVVVLACAGAAELCARVPRLGPWRPVLALVAGLLGLVEALLWDTTVAGLPTGDTVRALVAGAVDSWQLTLQSTWPARPDAELLLFVPLAVLAAAVLGVELLRKPLVALLPSLALLGLSQAYGALGGPVATLAALAYASIAAALLVATRPQRDLPSPGMRDRGGKRAVVALLMVAPTVLLTVAGALAAATVDPAGRPAYSLRQNQSAPPPPARVANPINEVAVRLRRPTTPVFTYTSAEPVDRWRLVVLDTFDGATWRTESRYRRMGATLEPAPAVTVPTTLRAARVTLTRREGPWVPSQALPASVTGVAPLIDEASGVLLVPEPTGPVEYGVTWREPRIEDVDLADSAIDARAAAGFGGVGVIPPEVGDLARTAVAGMRPSFRTALVLERYLSANYKVATGSDLPTGSGWPQLREFLLETKRGTSEQFAAAYVALARILGIPARLAVGYRAPRAASDGQVVVRNGDVLAWPEVAVAGVGWVPLDPGGTAAEAGPAAGLAEVTAKARAQLPPPEDLRDPDVPADEPDARTTAADGDGIALPLAAVGIGLLTLLVAWLIGVPLLKAIRAWRRRRAPGARGVIGAWSEARDRLRAHGVPFTAGMTVRDLAAAAGPIADQSIVDGLDSLAGTVDTALWSGGAADATTADAAWGAVRAVRKGLAGRPLLERVRAAIDPRTLLPGRPVSPFSAIRTR